MSERDRNLKNFRHISLQGNAVKGALSGVQRAGNFKISGPFSLKKTTPLAIDLPGASDLGMRRTDGNEFIGKMKIVALRAAAGGCA